MSQMFKFRKAAQNLSQNGSKYKQTGSTYKPEQIADVGKIYNDEGIPKMPFDIFKAMKTNPLREYRNVGLLKQFQMENGGIVPRYVSGLTKVNQRRLAKSIKRARHFGLLSFK
eukprot:NODE_171_length_16024_cov_0.172559.p11 type:complete len:113 gc:universal NODE_171_length_16024_cov_0.172559:7889-8227(+)